MKIYIVMEDSSEYYDGSYYPRAAFKNRESAKKYGTVLTQLWGDYLIEECEIEESDILDDILWVVYSEEAYSSGVVSFRNAFGKREEAEAYANKINNDKNHVYSTYFNARVDDVYIDKDLDNIEAEYNAKYQ